MMGVVSRNDCPFAVDRRPVYEKSIHSASAVAFIMCLLNFIYYAHTF